tara:strand:+ start:4686 stop:5000 length:315 start_codon:yes stop_codon:yes gene_type:complete
MNVAYHTTFTWMNPEFSDLRTQIQVPLFGEFPIELGVSGNDEEVLMRFSTDPDYNVANSGSYPSPNEGLVASTERVQDRGKMRASSLRNVANRAKRWRWPRQPI